MAGEDLKNRVDWLDEERRKDKAQLAKLEERLAGMTAASESHGKQLQELGAQLAKVGARVQLQKVDELLSKNREETGRALEAMEKRRLELEDQVSKSRILEKDRVEKTMGEFKKQMDTLADMREMMEARKAEQARQAVLLQEMRKTLDAIQKRDEERTRIVATVEEGRRQDIRRMADIQGEHQTIRQKSGEIVSRLDAVETTSTRLDAKLREVTAQELERRNAMAIWQEQQQASATERERQWKIWEKQSAESIAHMNEFLGQIDTYRELERSMGQAIKEFHEIAERSEQKLKEMAEIQRIQEDRLRQDWNAFQADDQKRWTAQNLTWEDEWRERDRKFTKVTDRLARLEEQSEEFADALRSTQEGDRARLETLANTVREWLARIAPK
jgi:predicted RNase H-like HicB family nuclease